MAVALAGQLREGTKKSHTMAENTGFIACFLKGVVEKNSYRKLISDLYFVYQAMEEEMAKASESDLQPVDGYVTPMHRIGVVPSAQYSMANQLNGYTTRGQENVIV